MRMLFLVFGQGVSRLWVVGERVMVGRVVGRKSL